MTILHKENEIYKYSNPGRVELNGLRILDSDFELRLSTHKDKKYMIKGDFTNDKWVHFGQWGMEDYTKHKDDERRERFRRRNSKWAISRPDTPSYLSYYLLW